MGGNKKFVNPFNSHEWPRDIISLQYQYNIIDTSDGDLENYQLWDF